MRFFLVSLFVLSSASGYAQSTGILTPDNLLSGGSRTSQPVVTSRDMDVMMPNDRTAVSSELSRYDQFLTQHCTTRADGRQVLDEICGRIDVRRGDSGFHPEKIPRTYKTAAYAQIPKNSKVNVYTRCEEDGRFYTRIYYTDINGKTRAFANPYDGKDKCITSPGQLERSDYTTQLPPFVKATGTITAWHIVSDQKSYAGAEMPFTVWLNNSGYAYHSGTANRPVDGYPASAGCFRMQENCAKGLFNLVRRVGTDNMSFFWNGYNHPKTGKPCTRPAGGANPLAEDITPQASRTARVGIFNRLGNWWQRVTGQRRPPSTNSTQPVPPSSVNQ